MSTVIFVYFSSTLNQWSLWSNRFTNSMIYTNEKPYISWESNGTVICNATGSQSSTQICCDGAGGAIIVWEDLRGVGIDIDAHRVDKDGNA